MRQARGGPCWRGGLAGARSPAHRKDTADPSRARSGQQNNDGPRISPPQPHDEPSGPKPRGAGQAGPQSGVSAPSRKCHCVPFGNHEDQKCLAKNPKGRTGQRATASDFHRQGKSTGPNTHSRWHALALLLSTSGKNRDATRRKCVPNPSHRLARWQTLSPIPGRKPSIPAAVLFVKRRRTKSAGLTGLVEVQTAVRSDEPYTWPPPQPTANASTVRRPVPSCGRPL